MSSVEVMSSLTGEVADRQAIRDLVDAWAHCADRRRPGDQAALFTADGTVTVYPGDPASNEPVRRLQGHADLAEAFKALDMYDVTTHFNGQGTVMLDGDRATGETYCLAHHIWNENGQRTLLVHLDSLSRQVRAHGRRVAVC